MADPAQIADPVDPDAGLTDETKAVLAAAAAAQEAVAHADPMRPAMIPAPAGTPEKFWDPVEGKLRVDELVKSYAELEKKVGAPKGEAAEEVAEETTEETPAVVEEIVEEETSEETEVTPALASAVEAAQATYAETGELSEEARAPLIEAGISNDQLDIYLAGVKALENALQSKAHEAAGGPEVFAEATAWAAINLTPKQIAAFNAQVGDIELVGSAVEGLVSAYRKANPGEGNLVNVNSGVNHGDVYASMAEFNKDLAAADKVRDQDLRSKAIAKLTRSRAAKSIK